MEKNKFFIMKKINHFFKGVPFLILLVFAVQGVFALDGAKFDGAKLQEINDGANNLLERYFNGEKVSGSEAGELTAANSALMNQLEDKNNYNKELLLTSLNLCKTMAWLCTSPEFASFKENLKADDKVIGLYKKEILKDADLALAYSDYLYANMSFGGIMTVPLLYKKALCIDGGSKEARVKLAVYYTYSSGSTTPLWNAFIMREEKNIESLSNTDKFLAYLSYSMFYIKNYDTEKAYSYLDKADKLYPGNALTAYIKYNYSKGKFGW